MTHIYLPICMLCQHRQDGARKDGHAIFACTAFPGGIPPAIIQSWADHRLPFPGDGGTTFARAEGVSTEFYDRVIQTLFGEEAGP